MSDIYTVLEGAGAAFVIATALFAAYSKASKTKDEKLEAAKTETIQVLASNRDAWKQKADDIEKEYIKYREYTHKQIEEANSKLLHCTEKCSALEAKTDMTPVMHALDKIILVLDAMMKRLNV